MFLDTQTLSEPFALVAANDGPPPRGLALRLLGRVLRCLEAGRLTIVLPSGETVVHQAPKAGPDAVLSVHRWRMLRRLLTGGDVGFAEGYIAGDWSSPDLPALIALLASNVDRLGKVMDGFLPVRLLSRLRHLIRPNSRGGSRRNIAFHYDLGNDFYREWLDASMTYSAAIAIGADQTLEQAQQAKLDRIIDLLALEGDDRVLEIGCGWGALAARIAGTGASVTGLTLSTEQHGHAVRHAAEQGLTDRVDIRLQDYRDADGRFDRIVSIEMLEAVGEAYWPTYFDTLRARLRVGGRAVLQVITMREDRFESYRHGTDFIQRYIFPGGMLPSPRIIDEQAARAGFAIVERQSFRHGYADTLAEWRRRFHAAWPKIAPLGFDERFRRLWDYYLAYCEAGFRTGTIDVGLYVLEDRA